MPTKMKVYAAIHDQIAEGHVWLKQDGLLPRCIVQITNADNRRRVYCEALQFDDNFVALYNENPRRMHIGNDLESSIVMSHWYRAKLGTIPSEPL